MTAEDVKYKALLPCVQCGVHNLPDSDGTCNLFFTISLCMHACGYDLYLFPQRAQDLYYVHDQL